MKDIAKKISIPTLEIEQKLFSKGTALEVKRTDFDDFWPKLRITVIRRLYRKANFPYSISLNGKNTIQVFIQRIFLLFF